MEQESEAWSPAAQDPEEGESLGGAPRGDTPNEGARGCKEGGERPADIPAQLQPKEVDKHKTHPMATKASAGARPPTKAAPDQIAAGVQPPAQVPNTDIQPSQRRHVCVDCGRRFTYPSLLISHRRMHSGERPFPCPECGVRFKRKFAVKAHQWIHRSCSGVAEAEGLGSGLCLEPQSEETGIHQCSFGTIQTSLRSVGEFNSCLRLEVWSGA